MSMATSTATIHRIQSLRAQGKTYDQIVELVGCSERTIRRAIIGQPKPTSRFAAKVMPADFAERARGMTGNAAATAFGVSATTAYHWASICGFTFRKLAKPVPAGFEAMFRATSNRLLCGHYGVSSSVIDRWAATMPADAKVAHKAAHTALQAKAARERHDVTRAAKAAKPKTHKPLRLARMGKPMAGLIPEAKVDTVSLAMRHLMRNYVPVCRSETIAGKAAAGLYRVGRMVLTESELMALAAKRGFAMSAGFAG